MGYSYNLFLNPREIEIKFSLASGVRETLERSGPFLAVKHKLLHQVTTYFDTEDALLNAAGLSFRIRRDDDGALIQTVKSRENGFDIAAGRNEWEWPLGSDLPDVSKLMEIPALAAVAQKIDGRLQAVFVSDIQRTVRLLDLDGNSSVEAVIDVGTIKSGAASEDVSELELELKSGEVESLYRLASKLLALAPLYIVSESKAARGWHLRTGQTEGARQATVPQLRTNGRAAEGLQRIINGTLGHLIANIGPTLRGDPEGLHQMHKALRDTRAALRLFHRHLGKVDGPRFDGELRDYARVFGNARDWDVFCLQTLPAAMIDLPAERLRDLQEVAEGQRQMTHAEVLKVLKTAEFSELLLSIAVWAQAGEKQPSMFGDIQLDKPFLSILPKSLTKAARRVMEKTHRFKSLSAKGLHKLRKAFDNLSNDARFVTSLYPGKDVLRFRKTCKAVKGVLGSSNDAVVTHDLIARLVTKDRPDLEKPAAALGLWTEKKRRKAMKSMKTALADFSGSHQFWMQKRK
ncbi:MAG: CHAD domain-containing protein [Micavibrio sp.]|nr:CHAD domain-containing protein [Micavibrio sp.]